MILGVLESSRKKHPKSFLLSIILYLDSPVSNTGRNEEKHTSFHIYHLFQGSTAFDLHSYESCFIMAPKTKSPPVTWFSGAKIAVPILEIQRFYDAKMPGPMDPLLDRKPDSHWINIW